MDRAPLVSESSVDERREYIRKRYPCISDCDMCGLCKVFHGKDPELAFREYIEGSSTFEETAQQYRKAAGVSGINGGCGERVLSKYV